MSDPQAPLEILAALEHEQWIEWSRTVAAQGLTPERLARWERYWVPYTELDEETKEHDRKWARLALAALPSDWCGHEAEIADAQRWRDAEAEGHIVNFTMDGYGLQHPPSCRPNLTGCAYHLWLADDDEPAMSPGRYRMTLVSPDGYDEAKYAALAQPGDEG